MKIIDKIKALEGKPFFSFEYFPPKTPAGVVNLYDRVERMAQLHPLFVDVTWGAGGSTADLTLELSTNFQNECCLETQMHLTCTNMEKSKIDSALKICKEKGIQNIIALRGDPPVGQERWTAVEGGFAHASDLVRYIRKEHGDYFGISVAGYPEGHSESDDYEADLMHLKEKVDAGADFILTQLFYDVDQFLKWVGDCRRVGITVPIVPGIMPINGYASWKRMTDFCKTKIPDEMRAGLEARQDDDEAVKTHGVELVAAMCQKLMDSRAQTGVPGLHMYTLNLEKSVLQILEALNMTSDVAERRKLPWRARGGEDVRPIFWANRPKSYVSRTMTWDDFPNGRWGDSRSPAFGELLDYHLFAHVPDIDAKRAAWGTPKNDDDVMAAFCKFVRGETPALPWCQNLASETGLISANLLKVNAKGFLTINSQPAANAVDSNDKDLGWGGPGGLVYQKAYVEFFCSPERYTALIAAIKEFPALSYTATNAKAEVSTNMRHGGVTALTWGVFPDREIVQPTIADLDSFMAWRQEAFALWMSWKSVLDKPDSKDVSEPEAAAHVQKCHDEYWLVNVVDNNFVNSTLYSLFEKL